MNIYIKLDLGMKGKLNSNVTNVDDNIMTNVEGLTIIWQYCMVGEASIHKRVSDAINSLQLTMDPDDFGLLKQMYDVTFVQGDKSIETDKAVELSQQAYFFLTHKYNHLENEELNDPNHPNPSSIPSPNANPATLDDSFWRSNCNIDGQIKAFNDRIKKRLYYKSGIYNKEIQDNNTKRLLQYNQ